MQQNLKNHFATFCTWIQPADIVAVIIILGGFTLKFRGADGVISFLLVSIVFYYFGKKNELLKNYLSQIIK